jgi:hypothetical protein
MRLTIVFIGLRACSRLPPHAPPPDLITLVHDFQTTARESPPSPPLVLLHFKWCRYIYLQAIPKFSFSYVRPALVPNHSYLFCLNINEVYKPYALLINKTNMQFITKKNKTILILKKKIYTTHITPRKIGHTAISSKLIKLAHSFLFII